MNEYEYEEVRGLPGKLPEGESILWQGAPDWRTLARRTFHIKTVALYFAALVIIRGAASVYLDGASVVAAVFAGIAVIPLALAGLALLAGLAWWHARTTVYSITNKRVVMRFGIAIQLAINLPFREIGSAALMKFASGHGEIPLTLTGNGRLAYLHLWPHVRPGHFKHPQPMLRCVPNAADVAERLTAAWAERNEQAPDAIRIETCRAQAVERARPGSASTVGATG